MKLASFTPRNYIISTFILSCVLLSVLCFLLYRQYGKLNASSEWTINRYNNIQKMRELFSNVQDLENGYRGYFLTGSVEFLEPFIKAYPELSDNLQTIKLTFVDPESISYVDQFARVTDEFKDELESQLRKYNAKGRITVEDLQRSKALMDRVRVIMAKLLKRQEALINSTFKTYSKNQNSYQVTLWVGTLLAMGALFVANMIIIALINRGNRYEDQFKLVDERFRLAMSGISDGIYDYDFINKEIYFSPSFKNLLGYALDELPKDLDFYNKLVHPDDFPLMLEKQKNSMRMII